MKWISVKDRLPDPDKFILISGEYYGVEKVYPSIFIGQYKVYPHCTTFEPMSSGCGCCDGDIRNVTHWTELPEPPMMD